jgi:hypothetical protein
MREIVCNNSDRASFVARQSATIVPDNRLALPPSLAVDYSRVFSILAPCWHGASAPSLTGYFILTGAPNFVAVFVSLSSHTG